MNMRHCKLLLALYVLPLFASTLPDAYAQDQVVTQPPRRFIGGLEFTNFARFDVQISDGQLMLAPLKGRVDTNDFSLGSVAHAEPIISVPATIENLAKYLRAADRHVNIVVSPSAAEIQIKDLKLRGANVAEVMNVIFTATDGVVNGVEALNLGGGNFNFAFQASPQQDSTRTVGVFDMSDFIFIRTLTGHPSDELIQQKLDEPEELIAQTLKMLHQGDAQAPPLPRYSFHRGTSLLIVVGTPEAVDVAGKIINALRSQSRENLQAPLDKPATSQQK